MTDLEVLQALSEKFLKMIKDGKIHKAEIADQPENYTMADYIRAEARIKGMADCNLELLKFAESIGYSEGKVWKKR